MGKTTPLQRREYYLKNRDRIKEKSSLYYSNNKEKVLERLKKAHEANPTLKREAVRKYSKEHPEKHPIYQKTWKERHPEKRKLYTRNSKIRSYGISPETYHEMLEQQDRKCAICNNQPKKTLSIDHDHSTGKVRGLLCDACNLSLGHIERKGFLEKALQYLARYNKNS